MGNGELGIGKIVFLQLGDALHSPPFQRGAGGNKKVSSPPFQRGAGGNKKVSSPPFQRGAGGDKKDFSALKDFKD